MVELKACPFCYGAGTCLTTMIRQPVDPLQMTLYAVTCNICGGQGAWKRTRAMAAEMWNTRPTAATTVPAGDDG